MRVQRTSTVMLTLHRTCMLMNMHLAVIPSVGLEINKDETEIMKMKTFMLASGSVDETYELTYLGIVVSTTEGTNQDVKDRLGKPKSTLSPVDVDRLWKSKIIGRIMKVKIYCSVKAVLL